MISNWCRSVAVPAAALASIDHRRRFASAISPGSPPSHTPGNAGFTLVEALVAMVILIFGLMAVTNLLLVAASSNTVANQSTAATATASQQLESLKATSFTNLADGGNLDSDAANFFRDDSFPGVGTIHTRWRVLTVDPRVRHISVRSEGTGVLSRARSRAEFTTYRACTAATLGCP